MAILLKKHPQRVITRHLVTFMESSSSSVEQWSDFLCKFDCLFYPVKLMNLAIYKFWCPLLTRNTSAHFPLQLQDNIPFSF